MTNSLSNGQGNEALVVENVSKRYGDVVALRDLNLKVQDAEFLVLLGPSGCGKTTLLRIIAGLLEADSGKVILGGKDITNLPSNKRDIGLVFQSYALFPHMTVAKNVAFGLRMRGMSKTEIADRVATYLKMLQLEGLGERGVKELSGGQQQRVATARALVLHPSILLLDEPLSNLDAKLRATLRVEITQLQRQLGVTVIHVTHDQVEAMTMSDRVVLMESGTIQQIGPPMELYSNPVNLFVSKFIGSPSINTFQLEVVNNEGNLPECDARVDMKFLKDCVKHSEHFQEIPAGEYVLGVRPEDISFQVDASPDEVALIGEVVFMEALGSATLLHLKVGQKVVVSQAPGILSDVHIGQQVGIEFRNAAGHLFDAQSEMRVNGQTE
jgi:multiple sugar transport system ATP-binding protein